MMSDSQPDRRRPLKHRLKLALRSFLAGFAYHTGLWRLVARRSRRPRLTILAMHNVEDPPTTDFLPGDMKTPVALFDRLVRELSSAFPTYTVADGVRALRAGELAGPAICITLDDGYRDNLRAALPVLKRHSAKGTVYVEAGAVGDRKLSWTHCYFWTVQRKPFEWFLERYKALSQDRVTIGKLEAEARAGGDLRYHFKRILKYEADVRERDRVCEAILREAGGDPAAIVGELYLSPEQVAELDRAGIEIGGHTVSHPILKRCTDEQVDREIVDGKRRLESWIGRKLESFAYPWGRLWDFDERAVAVLQREGFVAGLSMDPGTNSQKSNPYMLKRYAVDSGVSIPDLMAEASGFFDAVRRFGLKV